jgi:argininosuccinate lyase
MKSGNRIWSGGASDSGGPDLSALMTAEDNKIDSFMLNYELYGLLAYHIELFKKHVIPKEDSKEIIQTLLDLLKEKPALKEEFEDIHSFVDTLANERTEAGKNLRIFLSRNDQSHFDIRSFYLDKLLEIASLLLENVRVIRENLAGTNGYMAGHTHYRQAMPVAFATYFDYVGLVLVDFSQDSLTLYLKFKEHSPLGYGSGYGSPLHVDLDKIARKLGFEKAYDNPVHGSFYRSADDTEVAFIVARILSALSRFAQDLIGFSSGENGFVEFPKGFTTGSSLMPNKKNPDFLEMIQGFASDALGKLVTAISINMNKGTGYHREFQLSKDETIEMTLTVAKILEAMKEFFAGIKIDEIKAHQAIENSTNSTMEAYSLFVSGLKWKDAYRTVGTKLRRGEQIGEYPPDSYIALEDVKLEEIEKTLGSIKAIREDIPRKLTAEAKRILKGS